MSNVNLELAIKDHAQKELLKAEEEFNQSNTLNAYVSLCNAVSLYEFGLDHLTLSPYDQMWFQEQLSYHKSGAEKIKVKLLEDLSKKNGERQEEIKPRFEIIPPSQNRSSLDSIIGNEKIVNLTHKTCKGAIENPHYTLNFASEVAPKIFLIYGSPGCGKTMLTHALGAEFGYTIIDVDSSSIKQKYIGKSIFTCFVNFF